MRVTPQHIALFGNFGSDNLRNEASLQAMLDFIRRARPSVQVTCICRGSEQAQAEHGVAAIPIKLSNPRIRWIAVANQLLARLPFQLFDFVRALYVARNF